MRRTAFSFDFSFAEEWFLLTLPTQTISASYRQTDRLLKHTAKQDTVELPLLGFGAHAAELLLVAAQAPGVVADLF